MRRWSPKAAGRSSLISAIARSRSVARNTPTMPRSMPKVELNQSVPVAGLVSDN